MGTRVKVITDLLNLGHEKLTKTLNLGHEKVTKTLWLVCRGNV